MSLFEEKKGNITQEHFQAGRGTRIYLRNKDKPESINVPNAQKALNYLTERTDHYSEIEHKIVLMLPPKDRDQYLSKRIVKLYRIADQHISFLSDPELKRQYSSYLTKVQHVQKQARQIEDRMSSENLKLRKAFATKLVDITKKFGSDQQSVISSLISDKKTCIQIYTFYQKNQMSKVHAAIDDLYYDTIIKKK